MAGSSVRIISTLDQALRPSLDNESCDLDGFRQTLRIPSSTDCIPNSAVGCNDVQDIRYITWIAAILYNHENHGDLMTKTMVKSTFFRRVCW